MNKIIIFIFSCFYLLDASTQEKVTIELQIFECKTKESLPFANIISGKSKKETARNFDGLFTFETT